MGLKSDKAPEGCVVSSNPLECDFGPDKYGFALQLKNSGNRAAGRMFGDEPKFRTLLTTLEFLKQHSILRYKEQVNIKKHQSEAAIKRSERDKVDAERMKQATIKTLEDRLEALKKED